MSPDETPCRTYRFGTVTATVFPELVTIAVPYGGNHDDFVEASLFVERYTHAVDGTVVEDDDLELEIHVYPHTDQLLSSGPPSLPPVDPRKGVWDEPSTRAGGGGVTVPEDKRPLMARVVETARGASAAISPV